MQHRTKDTPRRCTADVHVKIVALAEGQPACAVELVAIVVGEINQGTVFARRHFFPPVALTDEVQRAARG